MLPHNISTSALGGSHLSTFHPSPPPFGSDEATLLQQHSPACIKPQQHHIHPQLPPSPPTERPSSPLAAPVEVDVHLIEPPTPSAVSTDQLTSATSTSQQSNAPSITLAPTDLKGCRSVLNSVQRHEKAWPFLAPVDPVAVGALDYFNVITRPMDLSTISAKLDRGEYCLVQEFAADMMLMFDNCYTYNPPTNDIHKLGRALESHFSLQFCKVFPAYTPCATRGGPEDGKRKRKIKPPKVFEPDDAPSKRAKGVNSLAGSRKGSLAAGSRRVSSILPAQLAHLGSSAVDVQIAALSNYLQTMTDQLVALSGQAVGAAAAPPKRRPAKKASKDESDEDDEGVVLASEKTAGRSCGHCSTMDTPMWRRGPFGVGTLCNKCGVKWKSGKLVLPGPAPPTQQRKSGGKKASTKKNKKAAVVPLTFAEKQELVDMFEGLNDAETKQVLEIIGRSGNVTGDVVEVDMDALDDATLRELYVFAKAQMVKKGAGKMQGVVSGVGEEVKPRSVTGGAGGR